MNLDLKDPEVPREFNIMEDPIVAPLIERAEAAREALECFNAEAPASGPGREDDLARLQGDLDAAADALKRMIYEVSNQHNRRTATAFGYLDGIRKREFTALARRYAELTGKSIIPPGYRIVENTGCQAPVLPGVDCNFHAADIRSMVPTNHDPEIAQAICRMEPTHRPMMPGRAWLRDGDLVKDGLPRSKKKRSATKAGPGRPPKASVAGLLQSVGVSF